VPCAPILVDITVNGRAIKAIAQPTKQAWLYVLDRVTGQPVWPIEVRPFEQSTVPMEKTSPTQRFVTKPPAFDHQGVSLDDLIDFTPELKAEGAKLASQYKLGPIFTPPVVSRWGGPLGTLMLPSAGGGINWFGGAVDPETKILYTYSATTITPLGLVPPGDKSDMNFIRGTAPNPATPSSAGAPAGGGGEELVQLLRQEERRLEIQVHHLVPTAFGELVKRSAPRRTGVVDQDVDALVRLQHRLHALRHTFVVSYVQQHILHSKGARLQLQEFVS